MTHSSSSTIQRASENGRVVSYCDFTSDFTHKSCSPVHLHTPSRMLLTYTLRAALSLAAVSLP